MIVLATKDDFEGAKTDEVGHDFFLLLQALVQVGQAGNLVAN